ncbi:MAG: lysophospholipid acyltransferase family protein [Bacteroidota bacterium]
MAEKNRAKKGKSTKSGFLHNVGNHLVVTILKIISILPFWMIYGISDFFYFLIKYVVKYRYQVITENLTHAFPGKTTEEIADLRSKFYRHFCDFSLETIKSYGMNEKQMEKRLRYKGVDLGNEYFANGKSIIVLAAHHNNWEWCGFLQPKSKHKLLLVYSPMYNNIPMEKFLVHARGKWGASLVPMRRAARTTFEHVQKGVHTALWLAADQSAPPTSQFWTTFMNREAPFFSGPEKIAIKTNQPIFLQRIRKVSRGIYETEFTVLIEEPAKVEPKDILLTYIRKIEEIIREEPEYYLWSHRRWKHTRPEGIQLTD